MKKIELHLHLDGSISIDYASKLLGRDCNDELVFVTGLNGKLYYINNQKNNKYKQ
jgi:hypothetical protein